ncbi:hypothetical protein A9995_11775 [Erythrobacter sp. QSSC1-22B]|nr:hypothetical protein A9995_11775 [Erythrobacter sp. QSSC1-22B]
MLSLLIVARIFAERASHNTEHVRKRLVPVLLGGDANVDRVFGLELRVATRLTLELAEFTRGTDQVELLAVADALGVPGFLHKRSRSRTAQKRLTAIEALALFDNYTDVVEYALNDTNPHVRLGAALALSARSDAPDLSELVRKLRIGEVENSLLLVSLMSDVAERDPSSVRALLTDASLPAAAKVAAVDALADSGYTHAPLLAEIAANPSGDPELQARVFRALGRTGHPGSAHVIEAGLANKDWRIRAAAAEATGQIALRRFADQLGGLLSDDHWSVRFRAGEALLRLGEPGAAVMRRAAAGSEALASRAATILLAEKAAS